MCCPGHKTAFDGSSCKGISDFRWVQKVELNHIYFISTHIHPYEGGGFRFAPEAKIDDGCLDICVVHQSCKCPIPILADAFLRRNRKHRGLRHYRCKEVQIQIQNGECLCMWMERAVSYKGIWRFAVLKRKSV